jgi:peptide/nickel transport system substrate-binding protein
VLAGAVAVAAGIPAAGCGGGPDGEGDDSRASDTLVVFTGQSGGYRSNFNPYAPASIEGPGSIFEPLFFYNIAAPAKPEPRLGTEYRFNQDGTELSITLREGVKWSDGEDFTADDVAFTFAMLQEHETLNSIGFDGETEVVDPTHLTITFPEPSFMDAAELLGKTWIVPEHIWSGIEDPEQDAVHKPVGTGPYTLGDFKAEAFTLTANPTYWDGEPAVKRVRYLSLSGNQGGADALAAGQIDWMTGPVPDIANFEENYPGYQAITIPMNQTVLITCATPDLGCEGPQTDPAVRHAIYRAMDREQLNALAFQDTSSEISPGFALPGRDAEYISGELADPVVPISSDAARARQILEDAGYTENGDGVYEKDGEELSLDVRVVSGWTDYITAVNTLAEQLEEVGIELTVRQASWNETMDARGRGDFQLLIDALTPGPSPDPYWIYQYFFHTDNTAEAGETANQNFARYSHPEVDAAIDALSRMNPEDMRARQPYFDTIQARVEEDMPYVPVMTGGTTVEYNTARFTGWPGEDDLYAFPAIWSRPDQSQIFRNLVPADE